MTNMDAIAYDNQGVPVEPRARSEFSFFGNGEFKPPPGRVVGVYYDKQRRIWRANWREGDVGKRKTKNFSVDDYGFEEARRLAIEYRLMKITEIAQMELNCPDIDRIRLSTCRAPAQPSNGDRRTRKTTMMESPKKRPRVKSFLPDMDPYMYNTAVAPASGEYYDVNDQYGMYWASPYAANHSYAANQYNAQQQQHQDPNYMWYYNPDILYSLYQQHASQMNNPAMNIIGQPPIGAGANQTAESSIMDSGSTNLESMCSTMSRPTASAMMASAMNSAEGNLMSLIQQDITLKNEGVEQDITVKIEGVSPAREEALSSEEVGSIDTSETPAAIMLRDNFPVAQIVDSV